MMDKLNIHKGYRAVEGKEIHHHYFGGEAYTLPDCPVCHTPVHQIVCLDMMSALGRLLKKKR